MNLLAVNSRKFTNVPMQWEVNVSLTLKGQGYFIPRWVVNIILIWEIWVPYVQSMGISEGK